MEEPAWEPLPPRKKRHARGRADLAEESAAKATRASGDEAAKDLAPSRGEGGSARGETYASRALENAALVEDAVARRSSQVRAKPLDVSSLSEGRYEHLDHTADVQFHAWGEDLGSALGALGDCLFDLVTERRKIDRDDSCAQSFEVQAADLEALVFRVLDELLFRFSADGIACAHVRVAVDRRDDAYSARVDTTGERFDLAKHPQGTEVKAITYSNMQIHQRPDRTDLFVIVDI